MLRIIAIAFLLVACSSPTKSPPADLAPTENPLFVARPYRDAFYVPPSYDPKTPTPLVLLMHGYSFTGAIQEQYFDLEDAADAHTFLYAFPTGTFETAGQKTTFWNATDACCNFYGSTVDDSAYLTAIIDDISASYNVDPKRIYAIGHSNGAFMAHRMACDHADKLAAIVSLAGATWLDMANCPAAQPIAVLDVHGDADKTINYDGGNTGAAVNYPSEQQTITSWGLKNGCTGASALVPTGQTFDLVTNLDGAETAVSAIAGCPAGAAAELWTIHGGTHIPALQTNPAISPSWGELVWAWLAAHPKP